MIHLNYPVEDPRAQSDEQVEADVRRALGIGDHPMEIHKVTRWSVDAVMASAFSVGRVLLVGRRGPPPPADGRARADECDPRREQSLLEARRRARRACRRQRCWTPMSRSVAPLMSATSSARLRTPINHVQIIAAERRVSRAQRGAEPRCGAAAVERPARGRGAPLGGAASDSGAVDGVQRAERRAADISYDSAAIIADRTPQPPALDPIRVYEPSTRPGSPLPHAWIDDEDGGRRRDQGPRRRREVPADRGRGRARTGARPRSELAGATGLPLDAVRIGHLDGDLFDPRCTWLRHRQIGPDGAILVRPDRFIAWRSMGASASPLEDLAGALGQILARPIDVHLTTA